MRNWAKI